MGSVVDRAVTDGAPLGAALLEPGAAAREAILVVFLLLFCRIFVVGRGMVGVAAAEARRGLGAFGMSRQLRDKARNGRRKQDAYRVGSAVECWRPQQQTCEAQTIRIKDKYG